jgi:soluble lytic murein transglycosylase-like protein
MACAIKVLMKETFVFPLIIGIIIGLATGIITTPEQKIAVPKMIEAPLYNEDLPPLSETVAYYDVPLSHTLQRYIYEVCADENVPTSLVIAMIDQESKFDPEAVSETGDYGLMQINKINHSFLEEEFHITDITDPYQNVYAGIKIIGSYLHKYENDYTTALLSYNLGEYGAKKLKKNGVDSTSYTESVLVLMGKYEKEVENE